MSRVVLVAGGDIPSEERSPQVGLCQRPWQMARLAADAGHQVAVIALIARRPSGWRHELVNRSEPCGIAVYAVEDPLAHERPEVVHRILARERPDCLVGAGTLAAAVAVNFAGELPLWADLTAEPMTDAVRKCCGDSDAALADAHAHLVPVLGRADRFSCVSPRQAMAVLGQLALSGRVTAARAAHPFVTTIPHGVGPDELSALRSIARIARGTADAMVLLCSGGFGGSTDYDTLTQAVEALLAKVPTVRFVSLGGVQDGHDPAPFDALRGRLLASPFRHRCEFRPRPFGSEYPAHYASAGAAILVEQRTNATMLSDGPELTEWLAAGVPVICTRVRASVCEFEARSLLCAADAGDVNALVAHATTLAAEPGAAEAMADRARGWIAEHAATQRVFAPWLEWLAQPTRVPRPGKDVVFRPLSHPAEQMRQTLALVRRDLETEGPERALRRAADSLARRVRSVSGRLVARRGFETGVPTIGVDSPRADVGCPRRSASEWAERATAYGAARAVRVVVAADADPRGLDSTLEHLGAQFYPHLHVEVALSPACGSELRDAAARGVASLVRNPPEHAEYLLVLGPGALLRADAISELVDAAERAGADLVYADEVEVDEASGARQTIRRPGWSPELLLSHPYMGTLTLVRAERVAGSDDPEVILNADAWSYDLALRSSEGASRVEHVAETLCVRMVAAGQTLEGRVLGEQKLNQLRQRCLVRAVSRRGLDAIVERGNRPGAFRVRHRVAGAPTVSVVRVAQEALFSTAARESIERADGKYVVLLGAGVEVITPDWIEAMLEYAQQPDVGVVGAKVMRRDGSLLHTGFVETSEGLAAAHVWSREHRQDAFLDVVRNFPAVGAACLMVERARYLAVANLVEETRDAPLGVALCRGLSAQGLRMVYTPHAALYGEDPRP